MVKQLLPINQVELTFNEPIYDTLPKLYNPSDAIDYLKSIISDESYKTEKFWVMLMNKNSLLGITEFDIDEAFDLFETSKDVLRTLILSKATHYVLVDNNLGNRFKLNGMYFWEIRGIVENGAKSLEIYLVDQIQMDKNNFSSTQTSLRASLWQNWHPL
jgi:hypothetical protein